jgi:hypothetical protein
MPITPFHFGLGLLFRGLSRHVSMCAFVVVNCLIDLEPVLTYLVTGDPMHRFFHTYVGSTVAAVATALLARHPCEKWLVFWNSRLSVGQTRWLGVDTTIASSAFWIGSLVGAWSHIWLDAFMHVDVEPWWPIIVGNTRHGIFDVNQLHALCLIAGLFGLLLVVWRLWVRRARSIEEAPPSRAKNVRQFFKVMAVVSILWSVQAWAFLYPSIQWLSYLLTMLLLFPGIFIIFYMPLAACGLFSRSRRSIVSNHLSIGAGFLLGMFIGTGVGHEVRTSAYTEFGERSLPLVAAIHRYEKEQGTPPPSLDDLVPKYLSSIPETGIGSNAPYKYRVRGEKSWFYGTNQWVVIVPASNGMLNWDEFIYFPNQDYVSMHKPHRVLGQWAYSYE